MNHLRTTCSMLIFGAILFCMGFTAKRNIPSNRAGAHPELKKATSHSNHKDASYYFYDTSDTFVEYATTDHEEIVLMNQTGVLVDENSAGGTLLEEGYSIPGKPHEGFPDVFLYAHLGH